jgi:hypothetical protein
MRGRARGCIATTPPAWRGGSRSVGVTKEERRGDDDGDVMPTLARRHAGPTGQRVLPERGRWRRSRAELGPKREGGPNGWLRPT